MLLILAAGARLSAYVGATMGEIGFLRGVWLDGSRRLVWLEGYAAALAADADVAVPDRLQRGIRLDHVSFAYPGTDRLALDDVTLTIPPGAVVAVVGRERRRQVHPGQAAGEDVRADRRARSTSTTSPLARMPAADWRQRIAGAFQDFFRFEFAAQRSVGLGDLPHLDDEPAVDRGRRPGRGAATSSSGCPTAWTPSSAPPGPEGQELSFGQWQKLALARGYMRDQPLLMILDEPTAALDAETEHELFERYAEAARGTTWRHHDLGLAPLQHGADGRPDRGARRVPAGRGRQPRRAAGRGRHLRRAVPDPGGGVPVPTEPAASVRTVLETP